MAKRDDPQFRIRLPADLKKKIEESAKSAGRSLNSEIEKRLEVSYKTHVEYLLDDDREAFLQKISDAKTAIRERTKDLLELPKDADPIERAIARYELRVAKREFEILTRDTRIGLRKEDIQHLVRQHLEQKEQ